MNFYLKQLKNSNGKNSHFRLMINIVKKVCLDQRNGPLNHTVPRNLRDYLYNFSAHEEPIYSQPKKVYRKLRSFLMKLYFHQVPFIVKLCLVEVEKLKTRRKKLFKLRWALISISETRTIFFAGRVRVRDTIIIIHISVL